MRIVFALLLSISFSQTAFAGFSDFFKTKPIPKSVLKLVKKNHLFVADVEQPGRGLKLFDTCFDGTNFVSKSEAKASRCVERNWFVDEDDKGDVFPQDYVLTDAEWKAQGSSGRFGATYTPMCVKFEKYTPSASMKRSVSTLECKTVLGKDAPFGHWAYDDSDRAFDFVSVCESVSSPGEFPLTQTIEVYKLDDNFSDRVYYHSSHYDHISGGQAPYGKYTFTIPVCQELPEAHPQPVPNKRK